MLSSRTISFIKKKAVSVSVLSAGFFMPMAASALTFFDQNNDYYGTDLGDATPEAIAATIINIALGFIGLIVIILIIYGGITWMTAAGNEERVTKAQDILKAALIGLLVVLASYGTAWYVFSVLETATNAPG